MATTTATKEIKRVDKPGSEEVTEPWRPQTFINTLGRDPNYAYKWGTIDNHDRNVMDGWEPVKWEDDDAPARLPGTVIDGTQYDSFVRRREMILYRMPKKLNQQMHEYYEKQDVEFVKSHLKRTQEDIDRISGKKASTGGMFKLSRG